MKLGILAASALLGVASLTSVSLANDFTHTMSRSPQSGGESGMIGRVTTHAVAPQLESVRPHAGMLPAPVGPVRGFSAAASNEPRQGGDIRPGLARE
jgi:hypothetical protein